MRNVPTFIFFSIFCIFLFVVGFWVTQESKGNPLAQLTTHSAVTAVS